MAWKKRPSVRQLTTHTKSISTNDLAEFETTFLEHDKMDRKPLQHALPNYGISINGD
jgi:hypothetical protein